MATLQKGEDQEEPIKISLPEALPLYNLRTQINHVEPEVKY